jgi:hypothetical protein
MTHAGPVTCPCVASHSPQPVDVEIHHVLPTGWGGPDTADNRIPLCPTAHSSVHWLLAAYRRHEGTPPWEIRRRLGPYLRGVAAEGWERWVAAQTGT